MLHKILLTVLVLCTGLAWAEVDVNQADVAALDSIRGIGPSMSRKILAERESGAFKNWGDFMARIPGIKDKAAAKLSAQGMTVNGQSFADSPNHSKPPH
jgi:competence protein ComEA